METIGINFGDYWRNELGTEFRNRTLEFVGTYVEKMGTTEMSEDNKHYVATLDISDVKDTVFPLSVSCDMTTTQTCLVAKIVAEGKKEVERNYALSQEQRAYERAIRQLKQAKSVYEEAGEELLAKNIGKNISMATRQLKEFCEKNNLKYYNWRTKI